MAKVILHLYSDLNEKKNLFAGPNVEQLSATFAKVAITYMIPNGNLISFNDDNEFATEFQIEVCI